MLLKLSTHQKYNSIIHAAIFFYSIFYSQKRIKKFSMQNPRKIKRVKKKNFFENNL